MNKTISENRAFKGSHVYLTPAEKGAITRAIHQYWEDLEGAEDKAFIEFYEKYDQEPLRNVYDKLTGRNRRSKA